MTAVYFSQQSYATGEPGYTGREVIGAYMKATGLFQVEINPPSSSVTLSLTKYFYANVAWKYDIVYTF